MQPARRPARRTAAVFASAASVAVTVAALAGLGSDSFVLGSYARQAAAPAEIWGGGAIKPVVANEADWLASHARLQSAVAPAMPRLQFGALDVIDVRPLPAGISAEALATSDTNRPSMLVSAREVDTGRLVRFIVSADELASAHLDAARATPRQGL